MALMVLIVLTIFDYFSGMYVAGCKGEIDSSVGRKGFITKCLYFVLIATLHLIDKGLGLPYPVLQTIGSWNLIINEGISIAENLGEAGVPISKQLRQAMKRLKDKDHDLPLS